MTSKTIIVLGRICKSSANPDAREFRVRISGPLSNNAKEQALSNLRENICICYHPDDGMRVVKEGEA